MKKLLLVAMLGLFGFAASANNVVKVINGMPACTAPMTVQFYAYQEGICLFDIASPVYNVPAAPGSSVNYDMCDPITWLPLTLWMPSYEAFTAIVCVKCPGLPPICLPEVYIDMVPGHACVPNSSATTTIPCCPGTITADVTGGWGGGACFHLDIHP